MIRVKYLTDITSPLWQAGKKGEIKELPQQTADILLKRGYVKFMPQVKVEKGKANGKGTNKR